MSEELLKALLQLFALASSDEDLTDESRSVVKRFLASELGEEEVSQYIEFYDSYVAENQKLFGEGTGIDTETVKDVCLKGNKNLVQKQKLTILLRLLEYIMADKNVSEHETEFLKTVRDSFNIPQTEFAEALSFSSGTRYDVKLTQNTLIADEEEPRDLGDARFLSYKNLKGQIRFLYFKSVNTYTFRYFGKESIFLNGQSIIPCYTYIFTPGSAIRGSRISPIYYSDISSRYMQSEAGQTITFAAKNIEYSFPNGGKGLHEFTIEEKSGKLVGIMGGSGAGKSTLLNVLNGNLKPSSGSIEINGFDLHKDQDTLKGVIGYVSQDDLLIEELTVYQNLFYNAKLCFDNLDEDQVHEKVINILKSLGLYQSRNLKVGSPVDKVISGGQRKRLNIALELIREPAVLFVDEPTSGLSSRDSENIMDLLKQLTLKGKLIFVVIHQPSSDIFKLFDKLIMLDLGGYPVYYGDPVESIIYFKQRTNQVNSEESECPTCGNVNPEQIFNLLETRVIDEYGNLTEKRKVSPEAWYEIFQESKDEIRSASTAKDEPVNELSKPNKFNQFVIFLKRDVLSKLANKQYMLINFLEAPVLAFILSFFIKYSANPKGKTYEYALLDNENLPAYIFMAVIVALFVGLTVSAEEIIRDRRIRQREQFLDLSWGSYLLSKIVILLALSTIQMLSFVIIGNWIMEIKGMTHYYWIMLFSTAAFANLLGLNISSAFNSAVTIYILIPFLIIPQLIFSGVIVKFDKLNPEVSARSHVPVIGEIMASRWAFEGLSTAQFKYNDESVHTYEVNKQLSIVDYRRTYWIPEIRSRLNLLENKTNDYQLDDRAVDAIDLLSNELNKRDIQLNYPIMEFNWVVGDDTHNQKLIEETNLYLKKLKKWLNKKHLKALNKKDQIIGQLNTQYKNSGGYNGLKKKHFNTGLEDLVTNKSELNRILEIDNTLFPQQNPIYYEAESPRAHFYAPAKKVNDFSVPTFWFNTAVIWIMTLLLAVMLYFDILKRVISVFNLKLPSLIKKK